MADNLTFQATPATVPASTVVATDKIDGVDYQRMKLVIGEDGVNDGDVSSDNPVPAAIQGYINATEVRPLRADLSTHSLQTIDYEHHEIHAGSHYFVDGVLTLAINHVLDFTWLMPNTTKWTHWIWHLSVAAETLYQVYENVVATNPLANTITPFNSDRNSNNTSGTVMKYKDQTNLAGANADTNVTGGTLIQSGIIGAGRDGGQLSRAHEVILQQGKLYCLRSTANAAGYINFTMQWYEHTNKA